MILRVPVVALSDRPGGTDTRQDTAPVTVADCSPGTRSSRGQSFLSCFLRWVFRAQSMKTTNAENDGKAADFLIDGQAGGRLPEAVEYVTSFVCTFPIVSCFIGFGLLLSALGFILPLLIRS